MNIKMPGLVNQNSYGLKSVEDRMQRQQQRDDEETVYDIDMQTVKRKGLPNRSRYYQGMIDLNVTSRKMKYHELPESYIIFICTFDEFNRGRHVYTFENRCIEDPTLGLDDGSHKIFLCAKGTEDDCSENMRR